MCNCSVPTNRDWKTEFLISLSMIIYHISLLQITISSLKVSFSHLMENWTCSILWKRSDLNFFFRTLLFISESIELIVIAAEKPFLQTSLMYRFTQLLLRHSKLALDAFGSLWSRLRASTILLESVEFDASPPVVGWQRVPYCCFIAYDQRFLPSLIKTLQFK